MNVPANLKYSNDHEWCRVEGDTAVIGINVNQIRFDPSLPNPTSMAQVTSRTFDRHEVLGMFHTHCMERYEQLRNGDREVIQNDYRERMYRLGQRCPFRLPDGTPFEAIIEGVWPAGELLLRHDDGTLRAYLFREVEFVIKGKHNKQ